MIYSEGIQHWADGSTYEGEFLNDMRHGTGVHTWPNGEVSCVHTLKPSTLVLCWIKNSPTEHVTAAQKKSRQQQHVLRKS